MSYIFISYSHKDTVFAHGLARTLHDIGFDVWIDERLDYGSRWPQEIERQLDSCSAFLLIMSPRSFASDWVQNELQRAKRKLKPIFPVLLEGDGPWLSVESIQFYDVRGGGYPDSKFYAALKGVVIPNKDAPALPIPKRPVPARPTLAPKAGLKTETAVALIGAMATVCAALLGALPYLRDWILPQTPEVAILLSLTPAGNAAFLPVSTTDNPEPDFTLTPTFPVTEDATFTEASLPSETETGAATATITVTETVVPTSPSIQTMPPPAVALPTTPEPASVEMVFVPEGEFAMGKAGVPASEPVRSIPVASFYIDKYEVTNALYKDCVLKGGCALPSNQVNYDNPQFADHPVVFVTWNQSKTYCEWRGARLPTEAEWEKAARGNTDDRDYPWGDGIGPDCILANSSGCKNGTDKVGSYEDGKSMYGAYDMAGNVSEWVSSLFKPYPYSPTDGREDPASSALRVLRGGNWNRNITILTTWYRNEADPDYELDRIGFRCARDATP